MAALWVGAWSTAAAADGWAWDSVTKVMLNGDAASLQPGSFDDDYARAAAVKPPPESGGGIFGKMNQAMAMAAHFQDLMQNGFAEKHYVAGSKERTDQVADRTATIVDCAARTITTLDLQKKTYRVVSMDQPSTPSSGGQSKGSGSSGTDSNDRVAIVIANKSLGARSLGGQATNGLRSDMSFTITKQSGESQSYNGDLVGYYSRYPKPAANCSRFGEASGPGQSSSSASGNLAMMIRGYAVFMRSLGLAGVESRISIKQSGPALPRNNLAMYEAATIGGGRSGSGTFVTERGNLRPLSAADPIFSVPNDFAREQ